jgi:competence protein ComEC
MKPTRFTAILLISAVLFSIYAGKRTYFRPKRISPIIKVHLTKMKEIQSRENFSLTRAFVIGDKRSLLKKQKRDFSKLKINHLFTPSGIHFSSFYLLFIPLIRYLRKRKKLIASYTLDILLCLIPFGLNQLYSLKRISIMRLGSISLRAFNIKFDFFYIFMASFIFDFFFGTFKHSPLSYSFSFLFIGSLLTTKKTQFIPISFLTANLLISFFFYQSVNLLGFILGFGITAIFSLLFPFIFLGYWPSAIIKVDLTAPFINILESLVFISSKLASYSPSFEIDIIGLILIIFFSFKRNASLLIVILLLSSTRIYNIPSDRIRSYPKESEYIVKGWKIKKGRQIYSEKKLKCSRRIILNGHQVRCKNKL